MSVLLLGITSFRWSSSAVPWSMVVLVRLIVARREWLQVRRGVEGRLFVPASPALRPFSNTEIHILELVLRSILPFGQDLRVLI
jgi:hypothetical protein